MSKSAKKHHLLAMKPDRELLLISDFSQNLDMFRGMESADDASIPPPAKRRKGELVILSDNCSSHSKNSLRHTAAVGHGKDATDRMYNALRYALIKEEV